MFGVLTKEELFGLWDDGIREEIKSKSHELKSAQDLAVYSRLRKLKGRVLGEIGGGDSRILGSLSRNNVTYNIEKFSGEAGGPSEEVHIDGVTNLNTYVGEHSELLPSNHFDALFSISVVEHVPNQSLESFMEDQIRALKVGGEFIHAIDIYIEDKPSNYYQGRWEAYREWVDNDDRIRACGNIDQGSIGYRTDMVSNPDNIMYAWGRIAPNLKELRLRAQCVSLIVHGKLVNK